MLSKPIYIFIFSLFLVSAASSQTKKEDLIIQHYKMLNEEESFKTLDLGNYPENTDLSILKYISGYNKLVIGPYISNFDQLQEMDFTSLSDLDVSFSNFKIDYFKQLNLSNITRIDLRGILDLNHLTDTLFKKNTNLIITEADYQHFEIIDSLNSYYSFEIDPSIRILNSKVSKIHPRYFEYIPFLSKKKYVISFMISEDGVPDRIQFGKTYSQADQDNLTTFIKTTLRYSELDAYISVNLKLHITSQ